MNRWHCKVESLLSAFAVGYICADLPSRDPHSTRYSESTSPLDLLILPSRRLKSIHQVNILLPSRDPAFYPCLEGDTLHLSLVLRSDELAEPCCSPRTSASR